MLMKLFIKMQLDLFIENTLRSNLFLISTQTA